MNKKIIALREYSKKKLTAELKKIIVMWRPSSWLQLWRAVARNQWDHRTIRIGSMEFKYGTYKYNVLDGQLLDFSVPFPTKQGEDPFGRERVPGKGAVKITEKGFHLVRYPNRSLRSELISWEALEDMW